MNKSKIEKQKLEQKPNSKQKAGATSVHPSIAKPNVSCWAFNMNQSVRVKLKDLGYELLVKKHNKYLGVIPTWEKRTVEDYKKMADKDGYTSFQLWNFMEEFGAFTGMCKPQYYDNRIIFNAADFEECPPCSQQCALFNTGI